MLPADLTPDLTTKQTTLRTVTSLSLTTGQGSKLFICYMSAASAQKCVVVFLEKQQHTRPEYKTSCCILVPRLCQTALSNFGLSGWKKTGCTAKEHDVVQKLGKLSCLAQAVSWNTFVMGKTCDGAHPLLMQFWDTHAVDMRTATEYSYESGRL